MTTSLQRSQQRSRVNAEQQRDADIASILQTLVRLRHGDYPDVARIAKTSSDLSKLGFTPLEITRATAEMYRRYGL